jgi:hypothetical protein
MKTVKVVLGLSKLKPSEKITLWGNIKSDMTGNGNFGTPNPTLITIDAEVNKLASDISAALSGDHIKIVAMHTQEGIVVNLIEQLGNYVEQTANAAALTGGDAESIVASAGMEIEGERSRAPVPDAPSGLEGISIIEGEIALSWNGVKHARAYGIYISSDLSLSTDADTASKIFANWQLIDLCHKPKIVVSGLVSGTKYGVRVVSSGTAGKSTPSNVIVVKVL